MSIDVMRSYIDAGVSVLDRMEDASLRAREISRETGVRICSFGHAGDGNLHIYACRDDLDEQTWARAVRDVMDRLYAAARALNGAVSGEHGIGHAKRSFLLESLGERQLQLMRGIKAVFDPNGILNPGKVI